MQHSISCSSVIFAFEALYGSLNVMCIFFKAQLERTQMRLFLMRDKSSGGGINTDQSEDQSIKESLKQEAEPSNPPVSEDSPSLFDLWVVGGVTSTQKVSRRMDIFQPDTNGWLNGPAVPMGLCYGAAVAHGPYMFVLGGVETDDPYTERSNMWNINLQTGMLTYVKTIIHLLYFNCLIV